jgi:hypothetical protein
MDPLTSDVGTAVDQTSNITNKPAATVPGNNPLLEWAKKNPGLTARMIGMLGGVGAAGAAIGSNQSSGIGLGQKGLTAEAPPAFKRQMIAPPQGYRPGFDPEHKYFTGIGAAGSGG